MCIGVASTDIAEATCTFANRQSEHQSVPLLLQAPGRPHESTHLHSQTVDAVNAKEHRLTGEPVEVTRLAKVIVDEGATMQHLVTEANT